MVIEENANSNQPQKKEGSEVPAILDKAASGDESSDKSFSSLSSENKQNQLKKRKKVSASSKTSTSKKLKQNDNDLTTMEGQLAAHPGMSIDKAKSEAKREYNRRNAKKARARKSSLALSNDKLIMFVRSRKLTHCKFDCIRFLCCR
jgi:hypothetical protein